MALTRKWFYISIFTTNHFQVRRTKREIERERKKRSLNSLHSHRFSPSPHLRSPSSLTHAELSHSILSLTVVWLRWVFLSLVDFFLSSTAFVYGFDGFTPPIHTPHLTSPHLRSTQLQHHLTSNLTSPHLTFDLHNSNFTSPHLNDLLDCQSLSHRSLSRWFAWSLWSLILLLLLWWCGWWHFGGFCVVWWWVLWSGGGFCEVVDFLWVLVCGWWWFSEIKFVWKLRKWLRKCENFVGK